MKVIKQCPFCGDDSQIELTDDQYKRLKRYEQGGQYIQEVFSDLNAVEREFLKTGACLKCQRQIFGNDESKLIKPFTFWQGEERKR